MTAEIKTDFHEAALMVRAEMVKQRTWFDPAAEGTFYVWMREFFPTIDVFTVRVLYAKLREGSS